MQSENLNLLPDIGEELSPILQPTTPEYTVSAIARAIKSTIEQSFANVRVKGEISGIKYADSGHVYFSLKDEGAVLHAICWKGVAARLAFKLEDGLEIVCTGSISTYPGRSIYQITASAIEVSGVGALLKMLEQRKKSLAAEGLFNQDRKKSLPYLPQVIGVVTSPSGAVIRDIIHRIRARYPVHILLWGVLVQGPEAAEQITRAIDGFHNLPTSIPKPDVIIVARGGGSVEDLWPFNEEVVIRAVARANIPIISAVGHETDTTLIDYVADCRAPTPTAAAEIAVKVKTELEQQIKTLGERLNTTLPNLLVLREAALNLATQGLHQTVQIFSQLRVRIDQLTLRLGHSLQTFHRMRLHNLDTVASRLQVQNLLALTKTKELAFVGAYRNLQYIIHKIVVQCETSAILFSKLLESYSYHKVVERGFAIVRDKKGKIIRSANRAIESSQVNIEFQDGRCDAIIKSTSDSMTVGNKTAQNKHKRKADPLLPPHNQQLRLF